MKPLFCPSLRAHSGFSDTRLLRWLLSARGGCSQASGTLNSGENSWSAGRDAHPLAVCVSSIFMKHTSNGSHLHYQGKYNICSIDS